ncbi:MAG: NAD-dependent epimerase/dehydratase family protein [Bacteroidetes bacterium]|nr:NAD-dependent epimerase/dehydratase family protein [Bacteroidota bacterium]MBU1720181.1 NAD-dependent epimerase/dehydratase family protein [Bacteroidota bacterium]
MDKVRSLIQSLDGPIMIFGAGGFIGINLLSAILAERLDVIGVSHDHHHNWRFIASKIPAGHTVSCDITQPALLAELVSNLRPKTIFNLAAYGAYSKQKEYRKIFETNVTANIDIIENAKKFGVSAFVQAGSSSEYGLNSKQPDEHSELIPNSHYAVSKTAVYQAIKYYGKIEGLPMVHLRLYSAFGPWEEPDRLIPVLLSQARNGSLPPLVDPDISRDFVYISDVVAAFIFAAARLKPRDFGEAFNVGTGKKTTIRNLVNQVCKNTGLTQQPVFSTMDNRKWDTKDWYADIKRIHLAFRWKPEVSLSDGLLKTLKWQVEEDFDHAFWNWNRRQ